jgi:hypothetical protein
MRKRSIARVFRFSGFQVFRFSGFQVFRISTHVAFAPQAAVEPHRQTPPRCNQFLAPVIFLTGGRDEFHRKL